MDFSIRQGYPFPLGVSKKDEGANFALFSKNASMVTLYLFMEGVNTPAAEIKLDPTTNRTGFIWHVLLKDLPEKIEYAYRIQGPFQPKKGHVFNPSHLVVDPYAKSLNTSHVWADTNNWHMLKARTLTHLEFNWENDVSPLTPLNDLIIYEMHVRGFTQHTSSKVKYPGTFLAIIEKIPYLKSLGVNAIELMPIHEFNETQNKHKNPKTQKNLQNFWGYSPINFFALMNRYASTSEWGAAIQEFKMMVKELHKNKIEVILDVVFNHTGEDDETGPFYSYKGIENSIYYMIAPDGKYLNFSGCGNTLNCNHQVVKELILNVLRYWVSEMHVDGFRFDLASVFCRGEKGEVLPHPLIVKAISEDPILAHTKLIAEPWDAMGLYQVGSFPGKWPEWNGKYRDTVRRFMKGTEGYVGPFVTRIAGSADLYAHDRKPYHSINFITAHDGFTLKDLVSYEHKHNLENGELNRDGLNENDSWNCGFEGQTDDPKIQKLRFRQMCNFHFALMVSLGTPMIVMGDEYGHTRQGNNNAYCHDDEKNWFLWNYLETSNELFRFLQLMIDFRKKNPLLRSTEFLTDEDVDWHGTEPFKPDWGPKNRFIAYTLKEAKKVPSLYIAFNAFAHSVEIQLPNSPEPKKWKRIVDTSLPSPENFNEHPTASATIEKNYSLPPYSALLLQAW